MAARQKNLIKAAVLAALLVSVGCGGKAAPAPSNTPVVQTPAAPIVYTSLRLVDGLSGAFIPGATAKSGSSVQTTDTFGSATFAGISVGSTITVSGASGYRDRNTLYCGGNVALWPNKAGDVDDLLTQSIGYMSSGIIYYPKSVGLIPSTEISADPSVDQYGSDGAMTNLVKAVKYVLGTVAGPTPIVFGDKNAEKVFQVRINPKIKSSGQTLLGGDEGPLVEFQSLEFAKSLVLAIHEITRTLGVTGSNPYPGLMSENTQATLFTSPEMSVLKLRFTRPVGARFAGDDDTMVPCSAR